MCPTFEAQRGLAYNINQLLLFDDRSVDPTTKNKNYTKQKKIFFFFFVVFVWSTDFNREQEVGVVSANTVTDQQ